MKKLLSTDEEPTGGPSKLRSGSSDIDIFSVSQIMYGIQDELTTTWHLSSSGSTRKHLSADEENGGGAARSHRCFVLCLIRLFIRHDIHKRSRTLFVRLRTRFTRALRTHSALARSVCF